ncbi:LysR substrate-binding domain-containing protein [Pseudonocardia eucalypti]|uniref:LysR substrate-binding domain-containing protein n=1 Tax=Pseudonocardia eucalypti TaxID=648755 RepID=A0ABP9QGH8_9PSEU|nr:DNA-binding transcriptional LysR family regulator [Pseudonocardia eucalypti]
MERRQLEYFLAVVEHGGFTNAARVLHVAQPSLSHAIAALESELGGALFHRLPHGAVLTAAGDALVAPARQVARDLATAASSVREVLGLSGGRLDIVAQTTLAVDPLAGLLGEFLGRHRNVEVRVTDPEQGARVSHLVRSGASELGLLDARIPVPDLAGILLAEQDLHLVLPPAHPDPPEEPARLADLGALRFVAPPKGTATRDILDDALREAGVEPVIAVETAHRAMIVPLVLAGGGAALLPRSMAADAATKGATVLRTEPAVRFRARLVWRPGPLSPAADRFVSLARPAPILPIQ